MKPTNFQHNVLRIGAIHYRSMPWRDDTRPYYILVSELMLQQTQVERVIPKFQTFIEHFPDITSLASAPLHDVLELWSGLGYNRRAKYLWRTAQIVMELHNGILPATSGELRTLPGIGPSTAGAIMTYAYNKVAPFVETNVRTVYIHHFFNDHRDVTDTQILKKLTETIDTEQPRLFYWALMDYGTYLKQQGAGRVNQSAHYKRQSPLVGSVRQVRGQLLKQLIAHGPSSIDLLKRVTTDDERFTPALEGLAADELIVITKDIVSLSS